MGYYSLILSGLATAAKKKYFCIPGDITVVFTIFPEPCVRPEQQSNNGKSEVI